MNMKTILAIITSILLLVSCRKDSQFVDNIPTPIQTEDWKMLGDNIILLSDRNILSSNATNTKLFIQTPYSIYVLDSNLKISNSCGNSGPKFDNGFNKIGTGNNFSLYFDAPTPTYLYVTDNNDFSNNYYHSILLKDSLNNSYTRCRFSNVDENNNFCLGYYTGINNGKDTNTFSIKKYHVSRLPLNYVVCSETFNIPISKQVNFSQDHASLYLINDIIYYSYNGIGFRFEYPNKIDTMKFDLYQMIKINNTIYATSIWGNSLYSSTDNGISWQKVANNGAFSLSKDLINIDNKLFFYRYNWIDYFDLSNNTIKQINIQQIHAQIKTVTQFKDNVFVGTDVGVYYKSVKHVLAD